MDQEDERRQEAPGRGAGSVRLVRLLGRVRLSGGVVLKGEAVVRWMRRVVVERIARRNESVGRKDGGIMMMMWDVWNRGRECGLSFFVQCICSFMQTLFSRLHTV